MHVIYFFRTNHATARKNMYDGIDEYYVVVKESGSREEEETQEEVRQRKEKESDEAPTEHVSTKPIYIYTYRLLTL